MSIKAEASVICTVENGLCRLTLNEPDKLNALSLASFEEIAAHLDYSQSDLSRHLPLLIRVMLSPFGRFVMQPTAAGAWPSLYAALGEDLRGGEAIGPGGARKSRDHRRLLLPIRQPWMTLRVRVCG